MAERWFSEQELRDLARPTMDRAIEALDAGDVQTARELCEAMKHEWGQLHDLMVAGVAGLLTFIKDHMGEEAVADAHAESMERDWRRQVERIAQVDRKALVHLLAATWRAHSTGGVGRNPGAFTITEDARRGCGTGC
jgi:hypothetical protein